MEYLLKRFHIYKYNKINITEELLNDLATKGWQEIEYLQFLPICCVGLMNRQQGIGVGYAFSTMSYNPIDVIDASIAWLNSKKEEGKLDDFVLHPYIRGIKNKYWKYEDAHWVNYGDFTYNDKKKEIIITELPFDVEFAKFEKMLNKFVENEEIKDWSNYSTGDTIEYRIDCKKGKFGASLKGKNVKQKIENKFKLRTVVPEDNLWVLDENNIASRRSVARGDLVGDWVFIEKGVKAGEIIVADGAHKVKRGMTVKAAK